MLQIIEDRWKDVKQSVTLMVTKDQYYYLKVFPQALPESLMNQKGRFNGDAP